MSNVDKLTDPKLEVRNPNNPFALITGASSGIGFEFAHVLSEKTDYNLILVARRYERLTALRAAILEKNKDKNPEIVCIAADLANQNGRAELFKSCSGRQIELLINNAGYGSYGPFNESDENWELNMIRLNCEAVVHLSHHFLPSMISLGKGYVVNVSSMASFQGLPWLANYAATKAFVTSFSLGLAAELKGSGVSVQALCPGPVTTEFVDVSGFPDKISLIPSISARAVAEHSIDNILSGGQRLVIPGWMNNVLAQLNRFFPRAVASDVARKVLKSKFRISDDVRGAGNL